MNALEAATLGRLSGLRPLLGEINDLKRVRSACLPGSLAGRGFARSWAALLHGEELGLVARLEATSAIVSSRLGAIESETLTLAGLGEAEILGIFKSAVDAAGPLAPCVLAEVVPSIEGLPGYLGRYAEPCPLPECLVRLADQPRAGATRPGHRRLILEPAESHADHSYVTAVYGVLVAPAFDAGAAVPFLAGLSHPLHNAYLPDSGFSGEVLLGDFLGPVMARFTDKALSSLPQPLASEVTEARRVLAHVESPEAKAFHSADVLDRVLQMEQYARVAAFELRHALDDLDLVHPGPLQGFQLDVLASVGLRP